MMQYAINDEKDMLKLTEQIYNERLLSPPKTTKVFYTFSDAMEYFISKSLKMDNVVYFSKRTFTTVEIIAIPKEHDAPKECDGPYNDVYVAYGIQNILKIVNIYYGGDIAQQFTDGAKLIYDYYVDCGNRDFCKMHTTGPIDIGLNVIPLNSVAEYKTGQMAILRLLGKTDEIAVFDSPEELLAGLHLPTPILIPIGSYSSRLEEQDSTVVITGVVTRLTLISESNMRRYQLTVSTLNLEIDIDVLTHYEIRIGNIIYTKTSLSALF